MLKNDLANALVDMGYKKNESKEVIRDLFALIAESLVSGEKVTISGFGTFDVKTRKGCLVRDIHTREQRQLDDYEVVVFRPGENLKDAVRKHAPDKSRLLPRKS